MLHISNFQIILKQKNGGSMKLTDEIRGIEVFYDGRCGMCCSFHEWINRQPRAFGIGFIPYQAAEAERVFPGLGTLDPAREMVVRTSEGRIFRGAEAWVWCLFSCANHQAAARRSARSAVPARRGGARANQTPCRPVRLATVRGGRHARRHWRSRGRCCRRP